MSAWYRTGTITSAGNVVTGTGTRWADNKMGIGSGQMLLVPGDGTVKIFEILSIDSDTKLRLVSIPSAVLSGNYAIASFYTDSVPDFARRLAAQLSYYQSQMDGWQKILTGTGIISLIAPDGTIINVPSINYLSDIGVPIGVPLPWPKSNVPNGWLQCNGNQFNVTDYPKLALIYPSGSVPDLRGEFIRGWDDTRGIDAGRMLISSQSDAIRNITGSAGAVFRAAAIGSSGAISLSTYGQTPPKSGVYGADPGDSVSIIFDASRIVPTASENRPRNVAFNYIVRAL